VEEGDAESVTRRGTELDKKGRRDESREPSWQQRPVTLAQQLLVPPCLSSSTCYSLYNTSNLFYIKFVLPTAFLKDVEATSSIFKQ
jgi:hypothetical protein